ncbi:GNAT family N-acetyltransferase [Tessaracoccus flavus]|uniref:Uncharacterized protein n=1 Tax=Tessaracoccus flavus TaxID=1610493 RepID=A0A1Q2CF54_9ACTN|nr:GNAT family protein [Tessaracoccus flavus]AQP44746.1 hypothetical protein RPIT_07955 [Tessaracoccus flavus]SDZ16583.1 aminoglycoside 6'-N-acetyltransferase [Tessaracoccus flavus]
MDTAYPIRTDRLLLRPLRTEDVDVIVAYRNHPAVSALQDWELPVTRDRVERQVAETWVDLEPGDSRNIGIEFDGELIGDVYVGLDEHNRPGEDGVAEIGFTLRPEYQGKGCATEAAAAVVDDLVSRLGCHRIVAQLSPQNDASKRVLERLGMRPESLAPKSYWWRGQWDDNLVYAMSADDWLDRGAQRRLPTDSP